jgi:ElaB/YqjD/DUF883 family membrane-anchored ribosome-binding protein
LAGEFLTAEREPAMSETSSSEATSGKSTAKEQAATPEAATNSPVVATAAEGSEGDAKPSTDWREQASEFAEQAKTTARDAATSAKNTTGDALHGLSKLIAETAETVDAKLGPQYGDYARKAAETVAGAADSLDAKDIDQLTEEARNFVRKSPAVAIGAAAVVGFVLMRMMRGSSNES